MRGSADRSPSDPGGAAGGHLQYAVEEVARLLRVDGAMVYLVDEDDPTCLRFEVAAGIREPEVETLIGDLRLPVGTGIFGSAVERGELVVTGDYRRDRRFRHSRVADRIVALANMRSFAAAPLVAQGEVLGGLGAYSSEVDHFSDGDLALLRALADHAAAAIWNTRLIERLNRSQEELGRRVEAQRTLGRISAGITAIRDPGEALQGVVDAAKRLLGSDGAHLTLMQPNRRFLRPTVVAGGTDAAMRDWLSQQDFPINGGINGLAAGTGELIWTADYLVDPRIPHEPDDQEVAHRLALRGMAAAPLRAPGGEVIGTLAASFVEPHAFTDEELELLQGLADQGAIAISNARLHEQHERQIEAQRTLAEIASQITQLRDPAAVLQRTVDEAKRLLDAEHGLIHQIVPGTDQLADYRPGTDGVDPTAAHDEITVRIGQGIAGQAIGEARVAWTGEYLEDRSFPHTPEADSWIAGRGYRSQMSAPLIGEDGPIGALTVYSPRSDAFDEADAELLGALAGHAAIVLSNARLYRQANQAAEELGRRVEAQRALGEIAAQITSIRDAESVLQRTVDEAARLLAADGGRIDLMEAGSGALLWAFGNSEVDRPIPSIDGAEVVRPDEGISGKAVSERRVVYTGDYLADDSFVHAPAPDQYVRDNRIVSVMAAPLVGEQGPIGTLTVHSRRRDAFDDDDAELLGALAAQAAVAVTNAALYDELRGRVDAQRALAEIAAQIPALRDPSAVIQRAADEALRLLHADAAMINPLAADGGELGMPLAYAPKGGEIDDIPVTIGEGISGLALAEDRVVLTGDYLSDPAFEHTEDLDAYIRRRGMTSVMSAPLTGPNGALGVLTVQSARRHAFDEGDAQLLGLLADAAAIAISNARLYEELETESAALERRIDSQRRLLQINQRLLTALEPATVLEHIADGLKSVVWYDYLGVYRVEEHESVLRPALARDRNADAVLDFTIPRGEGVTWWSVEHRQPVLLNDALNDPRVIQIPNTPREEEAVIIVPLISGDEVLGAMNIARRGGAEVAFTAADFELVQLFAGQAAIAVTNARLYDELRTRAEAQRALAEIAAQIAALHEPQTVLERAVAEAARLLRADRAQINLLGEAGTHLDPPIAAAPARPSPADVAVPLGSGIAGVAAAERAVRWTGDYLSDGSFPHDEGDSRIAEQEIRSMMSAPLVGPDDLIGTITVQSSRGDAFDADDAALLRLLADQAAIAVTNARLYERLAASEQRYRFLVDNSPDLIWSCDVDGRFTFLSEGVQRLTGFRPEEALGKHWAVLTMPEHVPTVEESWRRMRAEPHDQQIQIEIPHKDGHAVLVEIHAMPTLVDGRFAGAHGSVRDITERVRLERDLRHHAVELAAGEERAHLARELHDSVTQALFSMGLTARSLELLLRTDPDAAASKLAELRDLQRDALAEMRALIFELRPRSLEHDGLIQAIKNHANAVAGRTGLGVTVDASDDFERLPLEIEEALYRIAQEALHNVVKHAAAQSARIRLRRSRGVVELSVVDDGAGFDPGQVGRGHLGLVGMQQRADRIGAELRVESAPGRGARIEVRAAVGEDEASISVAASAK